MFATNYVQCWSKRDQAWKPGQKTGLDQHGRCIVSIRVADPNSPDKYDPTVEANDGNYVEKEIYLYATAIQESITPYVVRELPAPTMTWKLDSRMKSSLDANRKKREDWSAQTSAAIADAEKKAAERDYIRKSMNGTWEADVAKKAAETQTDRDARKAKEQQDLTDAKTAAYQKVAAGISKKEQDRLNAQREHDKAIRTEEMRRADSRNATKAAEAEEARRVADTYGKINSNISNAEAARQTAAREHDASIKQLNKEKEARRQAEKQRQAEAASDMANKYNKLENNIDAKEKARQRENFEYNAKVANSTRQTQKERDERRAKEEADRQKATDDMNAKIQQNLQAKEAQRLADQKAHDDELRKLQAEIDKNRAEALAAKQKQDENTASMKQKVSQGISAKEKQRLADKRAHEAELKRLEAEMAQKKADYEAAQAKRAAEVADAYSKVDDNLSKREQQRRADQSAQDAAVRAHQQKIAAGRQATLEETARQRKAMDESYSKLGNSIDAKEKARQRENFEYNAKVANSTRQTQKERDDRMAKEAADRQQALNDMNSKINSNLTTMEAQRRADNRAHEKSHANHCDATQKERDDRMAKEAADRQQALNDMNAKISSNLTSKEAQRRADNRAHEKSHANHCDATQKERDDRMAKEAADRQQALNEMNEKINKNLQAKEAQRLADQKAHDDELRKLQAEIDKKRADNKAEQQRQAQATASTYQKLNQGISTKEQQRRADQQAHNSDMKKLEEAMAKKKADYEAAQAKRAAEVADAYQKVNANINDKQAARAREQNATANQVKQHQAKIADGRAKALEASQKQKAELAAKQNEVNKNIQNKEQLRQKHNRSNTQDFKSLENAKEQKRQERNAANAQAAANMADTYSKINSGIGDKASQKQREESDARQKDGANNAKISQSAAQKAQQNDEELAAAAVRAQEYRSEKANSKSAKQQLKLQGDAQLRSDCKAAKDKQQFAHSPRSKGRKAQPVSG